MLATGSLATGSQDTICQASDSKDHSFHEFGSQNLSKGPKYAIYRVVRASVLGSVG